QAGEISESDCVRTRLDRNAFVGEHVDELREFGAARGRGVAADFVEAIVGRRGDCLVPPSRAGAMRQGCPTSAAWAPFRTAARPQRAGAACPRSRPRAIV